ncbi:MAG: hypothetical protein HKN70_02040 [Gammaproteobacteria bacterium]|nr:hypothetical protein [Gammaproteobacteria bacterium]
MQQRPSLIRLFGQMWLQNFRLQPVRTVLGSILSAGMLVALVFFSFFFLMVFVVISVVAVVYWRLFGSRAEWTTNARYPDSRSQRGESRGATLEGEFKELEQGDTKSGSGTKN